MSRRLTGWETVLSLLSGAAAGFFMPVNFYDKAVAEIVTMLGFLMAALVPAMALGASAIRSSTLSVKRLRELTSGVDRQIMLFGGVFLYALLACTVLIAGKLLSVPEQSQLGFILPSATTALLVFLCLRAAVFVSGFRSILRLTAQMAEEEARERDRKRDDQDAAELATYQMPPGYGSRVDLPN